jgi:hypothetical protein
MNAPARRDPGMTKSEVALLLALMAAYDQRTVGDADVEAFHLVAHAAGWSSAYARRAVVEHATSATGDRILPGHITRTIRTRREAAAASYRLQEYPAGMTNADEQTRWQEAQRAAHIASVMDAWARGDTP